MIAFLAQAGKIKIVNQNILPGKEASLQVILQIGVYLIPLLDCSNIITLVAKVNIPQFLCKDDYSGKQTYSVLLIGYLENYICPSRATSSSARRVQLNC